MAKNPSRKSRSKKAAAKKSSSAASVAKKKRITKIDYLDKANAKLKAAHDNREREYAAEIKKLDDKEEELLVRLSKLEEQKEKVAKEHGETDDVSDDDLIEVNAGGKIIAAKRGTLCQLKGTRMEALFCGRWDKKLQRDGSGRIFLDVNGDCFQAIVDYLNELAISSEEDTPDYPTAGGENGPMLYDHFDLFGLHSSTLIRESNIIKGSFQAGAIDSWLKEDGSAGNMTLLYRSSTDGLSDDKFHSKCDGKGDSDKNRTLVIIETTEGGIVGGYSNAPWSSSMSGYFETADKAFLFVLSGFNVLSPCKIKLREYQEDSAIYCYEELGPSFGHDLDVDKSFVRLNMGASYQCGPTAELNSAGEYEISEMEVFQVSDTCMQKEKGHPGFQEKVASVDRFTGEVNDAINEKWLTLQELEEEVLSLEESFKDEEDFIESFLSGDANDVVLLNVSGTIMATNRHVLMFAEDSVLAQQFDDTKWTEQGCKDMRVKDWEPDEVAKWVKRIKDIPNNVAQLFVENEITGAELIALDKEGLKMLGVKRVGTICLLFDEIKTLKKASSEGRVTLIEHSPYCFGKILDYLRMKYLHSINLIDNEPALPTVCDDQKKRFAKVVRYYFPGESSAFILG